MKEIRRFLDDEEYLLVGTAIILGLVFLPLWLPPWIIGKLASYLINK